MGMYYNTVGYGGYYPSRNPWGHLSPTLIRSLLWVNCKYIQELYHANIALPQSIKKELTWENLRREFVANGNYAYRCPSTVEAVWAKDK